MISELSDDEILSFLMNSEYESDFSHKEIRYILLKWKYFYRVLYGKMERMKDTKENEIEMLRSEIEILKNEMKIVQKERADKENLISELKSRKLSWKERFTGKIINKE